VRIGAEAPLYEFSPRRKAALEIRQIRYFVAIYEAGSVNKAAARLFVAQSALSSQLAQLEDELGVQLFTRSPQGVSATAFGQTFYEHSVAILQRLTDAVEAVRQLGRNPRGNVALGIPESISIVLGLPMLQVVKQRFPEIHLRLTEDVSASLKEKLKEGKLNLALLLDDESMDGLSTEPLVEERLYLVSRSTAAPMANVNLLNALASPLVLPDIRDGLRSSIERIARNAGIGIPNLVSEISSLTVIKDAVLQGMGATILPISCVAAEVRQNLLQAQEIMDPRALCTVTLCTRKNDLLDRAAASVFRVTVATARECCTSGGWSGASIARENKRIES
jgi:LysR family nitrogen assimilation transcriptional regulator